MKLPDRDRAFISPAKIVGYLLSMTHPVGRHKAAFFLGHGFAIDATQVLMDSLIHHADEHEVRQVEVTEHGVKYIIEGIMLIPDGRSPQIRSVWIIEHDGMSPCFVTAYPGPRSP